MTGSNELQKRFNDAEISNHVTEDRAITSDVTQGPNGLLANIRILKLNIEDWLHLEKFKKWELFSK